ncbi:hypothetical protein CBFG_03273 [Clostridiales bacterium 1_7_47FAA]|uniref:Uncharacterized protein n=1 Tax=Enterocloster hominis (ex Hitch et al. 2024) TaxID=1917870 RepID=A0ABV1DD17_9FIRM|nr:hypothetical protein CBFG_03273 [Clostridiales bacterium 1_7_47FAA]
MEGRRGLGIAGNVKFTTIRGNKGILPHKPLYRETEIKLPKDVLESFRKELCLLLDEGGSNGDFVG